MGKTIAIAANKGGVGKTTTVIMLAEGLARLGHSVVVVDLDPQSSASSAMVPGNVLAEQTKARRNLAKFVRERVVYNKTDAISHYLIQRASVTTFNNQNLPISLLSGGFDLREAEYEAVCHLCSKGIKLPAVREMLGKFIHDDVFLSLKGFYDWVLVDCPPYLPMLSGEAVIAADMTIIPTSADFMSVAGVNSLLDVLFPPSRPGGPPWVLVTRYRDNLTRNRANYESLKKHAQTAKSRFKLMEVLVPSDPRLDFGPPPNTTVSFLSKYDKQTRTHILDPLIKAFKEAAGS